jgi:hypothetical protein
MTYKFSVYLICQYQIHFVTCYIDNTNNKLNIVITKIYDLYASLAKFSKAIFEDIIFSYLS